MTDLAFRSLASAEDHNSPENFSSISQNHFFLLLKDLKIFEKNIIDRQLKSQ